MFVIGCLFVCVCVFVMHKYDIYEAAILYKIIYFRKGLIYDICICARVRVYACA